MPYESDAKPSGLAFLLFTIENLSPARSWDGKPDDRLALEILANSAANRLGRLIANKPTPEYEDLFAKLSDEDMEDLKARFDTLATALREADEKTDPSEACSALSEVLGDDFPIPDPQETSQRTSGPAIVTSSSSA